MIDFNNNCNIIPLSSISSLTDQNNSQNWNTVSDENHVDPVLQSILRTCIAMKITFKQLAVYLEIITRNVQKGNLNYPELINDFLMSNNLEIDEIIPCAQRIIEKLLSGYYLYELIDPNDGHVFYVGKGLYERMLDHELEVASDQGHNNKELQNRIQSINTSGACVVYRVRIFGIADEQDADKFEEELIRFYGLENLTNIRNGISSRSDSTETKDRIAFMINNYSSWCSTINWNKGTPYIDRVVFLGILFYAFRIGTISGISISARDIGDNTGISPKVALKSMDRLEHKGLIKRTYRGIGSFASKYNISDEALAVTEYKTGLSKCSIYANISNLLSNDAFMHGALNKSGALLFLLLLTSEIKYFTQSELSEQLNINTGTVRRILDKLYECSIVHKHESRYILNSEFNLDVAAQMYGTYGRSIKNKIVHYNERFLYHSYGIKDCAQRGCRRYANTISHVLYRLMLEYRWCIVNIERVDRPLSA